jgi:4'-phosphopantetheinyl transferase EntD
MTRQSLLSDLLPPSVSVCETQDDTGDCRAFEAEQELMARAIETRRREFLTARRCAHDALIRLGIDPVPVLKGANGEPLWPRGVVGSITHCTGYRAAAVARCTDVSAVGIDAEPHAPLPEGLAEAISLPSERRDLAALKGDARGVCWDRVLFSVKESIFKTWYPQVGRMLGFDQAEVTLHSDGSFGVRLLAPGLVVAGKHLRELSGHWHADDTLVLTAITVPPACHPIDQVGISDRGTCG